MCFLNSESLSFANFCYWFLAYCIMVRNYGVSDSAETCLMVSILNLHCASEKSVHWVSLVSQVCGCDLDLASEEFRSIEWYGE
jgi:hypothetical protein